MPRRRPNTGQEFLFDSEPAAEDLPVPASVPFRFIDLFAGIGGFRTALEKIGGECVFSSEWDRYSRQTYESWHGDVPAGDIREINVGQIPAHDILAGGFPCQPFSLAGVSKKNSLGRSHGFECETQGTLFFYVAKLIEAKRPPAVFLENVKNLRSHDKGRTWRTIRDTLLALRYHVFAEVVDAAGWVPQHRERIYIVCFDGDRFPEPPPFVFPKAPKLQPVFASVLEQTPDPKYTLSPKLWTYLQNYAAKHRAKGNGFGYGIAPPDGISRTLSARYYKDGAEILIAQGTGCPRRLTPRECARLMGFDEYAERIVVSDMQAYRQFGNAVVPKVIQAIGSRVAAELGRVL